MVALSGGTVGHQPTTLISVYALAAKQLALGAFVEVARDILHNLIRTLTMCINAHQVSIIYYIVV